MLITRLFIIQSLWQTKSHLLNMSFDAIVNVQFKIAKSLQCKKRIYMSVEMCTHVCPRGLHNT
jgi:hypothetical protein